MKCRYLLYVVLLACILLAGCNREVPEDTDPGLRIEEMQLSQELQTAIERYWAHIAAPISDYGPVPLAFFDGETNTDGIRYYGSYYVLESAGPVKHDIVYIPLPALQIPTEVQLGNVVLRSRTGFGLYSVTTVQADGQLNAYLLPLLPRVKNLDAQVQALVLEAHEAYEQRVYGSMVQTLPQWEPTTEETGMLRMRIGLLLETGAFFEESWNTFRYYGTYEGWSIAFYAWSNTVPKRMEIAGAVFDWKNEFVLYATRSGPLADLGVIYRDGLISGEAVAAIAEAHKNWE